MVIEMLIFVHWSTSLLVNFMDEPTSTVYSLDQIQDMKQEFPLMTFCPFRHSSYSKQMYLNLKNDLDYPLSQRWNRTTDFDIRNEIVEIAFKDDNGHFQKVKKDVWQRNFHHFYGWCYTLDIKKFENLQSTKKLTLGLNLDTDSFWDDYWSNDKHFLILMHSSIDDLDHANQLSSAIDSNLWMDLYLLDTKILIKKTKFTSQSTASKHCNQYLPRKCKNDKMNQEMLEKLGCQLPFFSHQVHISLPFCPNYLTLRAFEANYEQECPSTKLACNTIRYQVTDTFGKVMNPNDYDVEITMTDHVENYETSPNYPLKVFMSDIGGLLGIFLGWTMMTLFEWLFWILPLFVHDNTKLYISYLTKFMIFIGKY